MWKNFHLQKSQKLHRALPSERHPPAGRRVLWVLKQITWRILAELDLLCECTATRVKRAPQTHLFAYRADDEPVDVSYNVAEQSERYPVRSVCYACPNKLMGSLYDFRQYTLYIIEIDANNLFGYAMLHKMSGNNFL